MNSIIILLGQRVRSGTNFIGSTLSQHPEIITIPKQYSIGELNLFNDNLIEDVFENISKRSFGMNLNDKKLFLQYYGKAWLQFLIHKYEIPKGKTIFIKSPNLNHVNLWRNAFPKSKIVIIFRDGRDNVISSVKASNDKRSWHKFNHSFKKRVNYFSGRSFINHSKEWKKSAKKILNLEKSSNLKMFRYEDLLNSEKEIAKLLDFYNLKVSKSILIRCLNAPVVGSSFGKRDDGIDMPNWSPDYNKTNYVFTNKWKKWGVIKKFIFKIISGDELIMLGYEKNNNW